MSSTPTIPEFFANKNVFITGGTGFVGKVLIEKLLRSCPNLGNIYLLMREKKEQSGEERIKTIVDLPLFSVLKSQNPDSLKKIKAINGDVRELNLAISREDQEMLIREVNVIFHVAASVRFDDSLTDAIITNTRGTREVVNLGLQMEKLNVLVHVSTTYCQSDHRVVEERMYPPHADWRKCIQIAENVDKRYLNILTEKFINPLPNTYTFTKSLSEHVVNDLCHGKIPAVIYRPSVVANAVYEPLPGWVDNFNGPMGLATGTVTGIVRTLYADQEMITDYVAVDLSVKAIIISAWKQTIYKDESLKLTPSIYNGSNNGIQPVTIENFLNGMAKSRAKYPLDNILWHPNLTITKCYYNYHLQVLFYHLLPAIFIDGLLKIAGQKPMLLKLHRRIYLATMALAYFTHNQWIFENEKCINLDNILHPSDVDSFSFKEESFNLEYICETSYTGIKFFLLKENNSNAKKSKRKASTLWFLAQVLNGLWYLGLFWLFFIKINVLSILRDVITSHVFVYKYFTTD